MMRRLDELTVGEKVNASESWAEGEKAAVIAKRLGVSRGSFYNLVREMGLELRPRMVEPIDKSIEPVPFSRLAEKAIAPGIEKHLVPLLHYRGSASLGRVQRLWNFAVALKECGVERTGDAIKLSNNEKYAHVCEPPRNVNLLGLTGFFSRLADNPTVCDLEPGMRAFVRGLVPKPFSLTPVSEYTHDKSHAFWRTYVAKPGDQAAARERLRPKTSELVWPFILHDPAKSERADAGMDLVKAVNGVVSRQIPEENRADICQDLVLAVLEGKFSLGDLLDNPKKYIATVRKMSPWKYSWISLDAPMFGDGNRTLADVLS